MKILEPFQVAGAEFLYTNQRALLADEMGVGKTLQAITAALRNEKPTLVVCPASIKVNWAREIIDQDPTAQIQIVEPGESVEDFAIGHGSKWLLINYDLLHKYKSEGLKLLLDYKTLIIDEAHSIKETKTLRTKAAIEIGKYAENIYLLTGTPVLNRPMELFPLLKILKHPLGANWFSYGFRYCGGYFQEIRLKGGKTLRFLNVRGATRLEELRDKVAPIYLRRMKVEVLPKLPPKNINIIKVTLTEPHATLYANALERYYTYLESIKDELIKELGSIEAYDNKIENIKASQHLVELQKLQHVTSAAKIRRVAADAYKIVQQGGKALIFCSQTETLQRLKKIFVHNKVKVVTLNGQTKNENRVKAVDDFQQDPDTKVFIGNIKAAGVGITLTAAHQVFFIDSEWTPGLNQQAEDRAHRKGQMNTVEVNYYVIADTIDEDKQEALEIKRKIINSILGEGEANNIKADSIVKAVLKRSLERRRELSTAKH